MKSFIRPPLVGTRVDHRVDSPEADTRSDPALADGRRDDDLLESMYDPSPMNAARTVEAKWRDRLQSLGRSWGKFDRR